MSKVVQSLCEYTGEEVTVECTYVCVWGVKLMFTIEVPFCSLLQRKEVQLPYDYTERLPILPERISILGTRYLNSSKRINNVQ